MKYWIIKIHGWGTLYAKGTEEQAEQWRRAKASWEHAIGTKRIAEPQEITDHKWERLSSLLPK